VQSSSAARSRPPRLPRVAVLPERPLRRRPVHTPSQPPHRRSARHRDRGEGCSRHSAGWAYPARGTGSRRRPRGPSIRAGTASRTTSVSGPPRCRMKRFTRHGAVHKSSQPAAWAQRMHLRPGTRDRHRTEVVLLPKWRPDLSPRASGAPDEPKFTDSVFSGLPHHTAITAMITVGIRMTSLIVLDEYATDAGDVERTGGRGACPGDPKAAFDGKPGDPLADLSCLHRTSNGAVWVTAAYQHPWMQLDVPRILATKRIFCFDTIRIVCYVVQDNPREDSP
jgi:hypothetical protein